MKQTIISHKKKYKSISGVQGSFLSNGSWTFINQFGNLVFSFLIMIFLRNWLGEEDSGTFTAGFSYAFLLAQLAIFGFDNLSIREITDKLSKNDLTGIKSYHRFSNFLVWTISVSLTIISSIYIYYYVTSNVFYYILSILITPFLTMLILNQFKILGLGFVSLSQSPEKLVRPGLFLLSLIVIHSLVPEHENLTVILTINIILFVLTWFISDINFRLKADFNLAKPHRASLSKKAIKDKKKWLYAAGGLFIYSVIGHLNGKIDIIMLDKMLDNNASLSYYNSATRFAAFISFGALIVNQIMGPVISTHLKNNEKDALSRIIARSSLFSLLIGIAVLGFYIIFGDWLFNFLFDRAVPQEQEVLMISSIGNLFQVLAGSAAFLLIMNKATSRFATISIAAGLIVNAILNLILIPSSGIIGASIGTSVSMFIWCVLMIIFTIRKTKFNPTCFTIHLFR